MTCFLIHYMYRKLELEQAEKAEQQLLLEHDLRKAIDRINVLEADGNRKIKESDLKDKQMMALKSEKSSLESSMYVCLCVCVRKLNYYTLFRTAIHYVNTWTNNTGIRRIEK